MARTAHKHLKDIYPPTCVVVSISVDSKKMCHLLAEPMVRHNIRHAIVGVAGNYYLVRPLFDDDPLDIMKETPDLPVCEEYREGAYHVFD